MLYPSLILQRQQQDDMPRTNSALHSGHWQNEASQDVASPKHPVHSSLQHLYALVHMQMQRHAASVPYAQLAVTEMRVLKAMNWRMAGHTVADVLPPVVHMLEPAINSTALPCGQSKDIIKLILDTALDVCLQALAGGLRRK